MTRQPVAVRSVDWRYSAVLLLVGAALPVSGTLRAQTPQTLESPDGRIRVDVRATDRLRYDVRFDGKLLLQDATLALVIDGDTLGVQPHVTARNVRSVDTMVEPVVRQKAARLRDRYRELRLDLRGHYAVVFRAYDEGVAYRFETTLPRDTVKVEAEEARFPFPAGARAWFPSEEGFFSHNERAFTDYALRELTDDSLASVPVVVNVGGVKVALADADIEEYPGIWFRGTGTSTVMADFPAYPLEETLHRDRDFQVTKRAGYLAVTRGTRTYPWRVMGIAADDADLITSSLVYLLGSPSRVDDPTWIHPGKVAWDWYNANNIYGVGFKSGVNTETYKYYIDFASQYGIEYIILDEGWYRLGNLLDVVPEMDIQALVDYGRRKHVGIILWVVAKTLADQMEPALDQFQRWGVKGVKVDFMQRDDQKMMEFYHTACREAAKRHLLVDFHGAIRPATMTRTWPNILSTEGVRGLEQDKWSLLSNPEHNVTIPFTRMFLGPMDYTPGAMRNASQKSFAPVWEEPMSPGTRAHQLAMYVVFESPLQMLADNPSNYLREPEVMEFLGPVPTTWDETRVLEARIGDYVAIARRRGSDWYIGAMTDWTPRDLEIDLSFLPEGTFAMEAWEDGVNADRHAADYRKTSRQVDRTERLTVHLAPGGGWVAHLHGR